MSVLIAIIGYTLLAGVFILDKFILTKSVPKPAVYTFYSTVFLLFAVGALPFGGGFLGSYEDWLVAGLSGITFGIGLFTIFIAVKRGEASHVNPYSGAVITITTFFIARVILGETLSYTQQMGIVILVAASILLSYEKVERPHGIYRSFFWATVSGVAFAVSHTSAKYLYDLYPFVTAFVWTRVPTGIFALPFFLLPSVRATFVKKRKAKRSFARQHAIGIVITTKICAVIATILIQYAIAIGSASVVTALSGLQFTLMFVMILLLTRLAPRVFREYFTKKELIVQSIAIILVVLGSALVV